MKPATILTLALALGTVTAVAQGQDIPAQPAPTQPQAAPQGWQPAGTYMQRQPINWGAVWFPRWHSLRQQRFSPQYRPVQIERRMVPQYRVQPSCPNCRVR